MKHLLAVALLALVSRVDAAAPAVATHPPEEWAFQDIVIVAVQSDYPNAPVSNAGNPQVQLYQGFGDAPTCQAARLLFNIYGISIPLGTGSGLIAHMGRTTSECFRMH